MLPTLDTIIRAFVIVFMCIGASVTLGALVALADGAWCEARARARLDVDGSPSVDRDRTLAILASGNSAAGDRDARVVSRR